MESQNGIHDIKEGSLMTDKTDIQNDKVVTLRPKGNRKDINKEPEMKELKRMIRDGELDPDRTIEHLKEKDRTEGN